MKKQPPINSAVRNAIWTYPKSVPPRFPGAPTLVEMTRSAQMPDVFALPAGSDVTVELYGNALSLWLDADRLRVYTRKFHYVSFRTEEEARYGLMQLWREVALLESARQVEEEAAHWYEEQHGRQE